MRKIDIISQLNMLLVNELSLAEHDGISLNISDEQDDCLYMSFASVWIADKAMNYDLYIIRRPSNPAFVHRVAVRNNNTIELSRFILDKLGKQDTIKLLEYNKGE